MKPSQVNEFKAIYNDVWTLYNDENRFKDFKEFDKKENALWNRVIALSKSVGKGLVPGKLLQWGVADGKASYLVVKVGKRSTQVVHLPFGDAYQFAGVYESKGKLVVPTSIAGQAVGMDDFWNGVQDASEDFYNKTIKVGQVVHYSNGFGQYVRCWVTLDKYLLPIELVGEWRQYDLPYRYRNGEICLGYHAENIKKGKTFKPHASNLYEFSKDLQAKLDPRHLEAISLVVPPMTKEQEEEAGRWQLIETIQKVVGNCRDAVEAIKKVRELVK
jgi:hypothetical protein